MRPGSSVLARILIAAGLLFALVSVNHAIYSKERIKQTGVPVFLELAPVDPRSLMQGDYMALRFVLAQQIDSRREVFERFDRVPVVLDERGVGTLDLGRNPNAVHIRYRVQRSGVWLGTNAYFFEEGTADRYASARYGEFRVDKASGEAVLVGLRDEHLNLL